MARKQRNGQTPLALIFVLGLTLFSLLSICVNHVALQNAYSQQEASLLSTHADRFKKTETSEYYSSAIQENNPKGNADTQIQDLTSVAMMIETERQRIIRSTLLDKDRPAIAWLLSYPNSGTSFTMRMTNFDSNTTVAVNYPQEPLHLGHDIEPLYNSSKVPFILNPNMSLPSKYIMTKTHCAGYCTHCPPDSYANIKLDVFIERCRASGDKDKDASYNNTIQVEKAVHLMRDPIDNIVSNYRLLVKNFQRRKQPRLIKQFTNDKEGFFKFCLVSDNKWRKKDRQIFQEDFHKMKKIKCHALFYRWTQWHNLAYEMTIDELKIPTLNLAYEEYGSDFDGMKEKLFGFLELDSVQETIPFVAGKTYRDYFTKEERDEIMDMIKHFAKPQIWDMAKRYLD